MILVGRLVDSNGNPLTGFHYRIATWEQREAFAQSGFTSIHGRIFYENPAWDEYWGPQHFLDVALGQGYARSSHCIASRLFIDLRGRSGTVDLGDLKVNTEDIVVSGVVIDAGGAAVSGADIAVFPSSGSSGEEEWLMPFNLLLHTDRSGRFTLVGGYRGVQDFDVVVRYGALGKSKLVKGIKRGQRNIQIQIGAKQE